MTVKSCFLFFLSVFFPVFVLANGLSFKCAEIGKPDDNLKLVYSNSVLETDWYEADSDSVSFGGVVSNKINYLFWHRQYYAKIVAIYGSDSINETLRYLRKKYGHPFQSKNRIYGWIADDKIILSRRFSLHLGQVEIYCRDLYEKKHNLNDLENGARP